MRGFTGWKIVAVTVMVIALLLSFLPLVFAAGRDYPFLKNASAAPPVATDFDYIIVGGGTAGCPLAATLSLNYSVLLLERGNTPYGNPDVENAANFGQLISNIHGNTWSSPVQSFQSQDGVFNRRARVLGGGSVHRILFALPVPGSPPRASGIVFSDSLGVRHQALLRQAQRSEVLVAAGAIGSPHLLMLSGVGDGAILRSHDIPVVLNLPGVGKDMTDNPANAIYVPSPIPVETSLIQTVGITDFGGFIEAVSGTQASLSQVASLGTVAPGLKDDALLFKYAEELNKLPHDTQRILGQAGVILQKVDGPLSSGSLSLYEINVEDSPLVRFNNFSAPEDLFTCIETARVVQQILHTKTMRNFTYTSIPDTILRHAEMIGHFLPTELDVITLADWCRDTVTTIWHYHGGCQVGSVVDEEYRVVGVAGLRVIDGSTFNSSPRTNPQATVMMLGRYMGLKIHRDRH